MRKLLLLSLVVFGINSSWAIDNKPSELGYTTLNNGVSEQVDANGKVNVKEFFSFMCPFCQKMEPTTEELASNKDINLERIQVSWDDRSKKLIKILDIYQKYQEQSLYQATFDEMVPLEGEPNSLGILDGNNFKAFLIKNGVQSDKVNQMVKDYNNGQLGFDDQVKASRTTSLMKAYAIDGTPTFVVANKYVVTPAIPETTKSVVLSLVNKVLQDTAAAKKSSEAGDTKKLVNKPDVSKHKKEPKKATVKKHTPKHIHV